MEMESIKERERASMLRKCAQHLELESVNGKYSRENFKRGILNKVRLLKKQTYSSHVAVDADADGLNSNYKKFV